MSKKNYVALHNHSHYSLLDGYATIDEYIKAAKDLGMIGIGLADHGTASGLYKFITRAKDAGLIPVPGLEFYVAPENPEGAKVQRPVYYGPGGRRAPKYDVPGNGAYTHLTVFAYNNKGLENLFKLTSISWQPENYYFKPRIDTNMLAEHSEGLIVTTGCPSSEVNRRFLLGQDDKAYEYANRLKSIFGDNMYVEVMNHEMEDDELERILLPKLIKLSRDLNIPMIATNDSHYAFKEDAAPHERVLSIQTKTPMTVPPFHEGGTRFAFSGPEYYIKSYDEMYEVYPEEIAEEALANTIELTMKCKDIKLEYDPHLRPEIDIPEGHTPATYLQELILEGFKEKRKNASPEVVQESIKRLRHEFEVIHSNDFITYFLVVHDYIKYAHDNGILVGAGRGCFLPGSKVKSTQGVYRNIEDIKPGEKVQTHDTTYQVVEDTFIYDVVDEDMVKITLSNGREINATADHLIFHKDKGFIKAEEFVVGDIMLGAKGRRELFDYACDSCGSIVSTDKQTFDKRAPKGYYKPEGEYWCYDCVKSNLHAIPAVQEGSIRGAKKSRDCKKTREKISQGLKRHWAENYDERMEKWHAYMQTPAYQEYRQRRREESLKLYSDPKKLEELARQGRSGYKTGYFISYQQDKKKMYYASSYELKAMTILETDSEVHSFDRCRRRIPYIKPSTGLVHNYLPDLEVVDKDGNITVIEVKAKWQLQEEDTFEKLVQAEEFLSEEGINFEVWTEDTFKELNDEWHNDIEVVSIERYKYTGKVYDLQVANVHNYTLEGVTVHNSVGGSEIAYVLDISNTDPIKYDLLFERFLSPGRGSIYQIDYVDGVSEEISVSSKKRVYMRDGTSVVKYIHEIDPGETVNYDNEKRTIKDIYVKVPGSAPDVDTDFHTEGREDVIEYIINKYGRDNVANIVTFGTFKAKRAFKAMCTAYRIPFSLANKASDAIPDQVDGVDIKLSDLMDPSAPRYNEGVDFRRLTEGPEWAEVVEMAAPLDGRISETGVHPCGLIVSNQPLAGIIPLQVRQRDNTTVTQWEYPELESLGLIKMDLLGLELLNTIQQTVDNIKLTNESTQDKSLRKPVPDMRKLVLGDMDDPKTYETLKSGHTIGIFQLSSPGVRELLRRAQPESFMDIATITALYRPGPMSTNAHLEWADRKTGAKEIEYIDPGFEGTVVQDILEDTSGILVFQEQLMQIVTRYAGMTSYEADRLRKAMGKKDMSVMMTLKPKFIEGAIENGSTERLATKLWDTMEGFAQYGFNKSHSVSYAINIYQAVYLKTHYPSEFMAALIQQGFGDPSKVAMYLQEAQRMGLKVGPVDINTSQVKMAASSPEEKSDIDIVYGFSGVKQVNDELSEAIVLERNKNGEYKSVADFIKRITKRYKITSGALNNLAIAGAFDRFGASRKLVSEKANMLISSANQVAKQGASLFDMLGASTDTGVADVTESIEITGEDFDYNEMIKLEADSIGRFVSGHPTARLGHIARMYQPTTIRAIRSENANRKVYNVLGTITQIQSKTNRSGRRSIAVMIDDGTDTIATYMPRDIVNSIEKGSELKRMREAQEKGKQLRETRHSEQLRELVMDESIKPMDELEKNEVYRFQVRTSYYGGTLRINVIDVERLHTAPDGSLPFEVDIVNEQALRNLEAVVNKHKGNQVYVRYYKLDGTVHTMETQVDLSLQFIIDVERAIGRENVRTEGI